MSHLPDGSPGPLSGVRGNVASHVVSHVARSSALTALGRLHDICIDLGAVVTATDGVRADLTIDDPRRPRTPIVVPLTGPEAGVLAETWRELADLAASLAAQAGRVADACAATAGRPTPERVCPEPPAGAKGS